jgi:hypothetical protein
MGGIGGDAAAAAAVEYSEAEGGRSPAADADDDDGGSAADSSSSGDLGAETRTPLLQQPRNAPAHAEAAELEQMAADMPTQVQVSDMNMVLACLGEVALRWLRSWPASRIFTCPKPC